MKDPSQQTSCLSDIKLQDGEIVLAYEDVELVQGEECIIQDILSSLKTDKGVLFYAKDYGAGLPRFIHASADGIIKTEVKALIINALQKEPRVVADSWNVKVSSKNKELGVELSFNIFDNPDPINLILRIGAEEGVKIYEN